MREGARFWQYFLGWRVLILGLKWNYVVLSIFEHLDCLGVRSWTFVWVILNFFILIIIIRIKLGIQSSKFSAFSRLKAACMAAFFGTEIVVRVLIWSHLSCLLNYLPCDHTSWRYLISYFLNLGGIRVNFRKILCKLLYLNICIAHLSIFLPRIKFWDILEIIRFVIKFAIFLRVECVFLVADSESFFILHNYDCTLIPLILRKVNSTVTVAQALLFKCIIFGPLWRID